MLDLNSNSTRTIPSQISNLVVHSPFTIIVDANFSNQEGSIRGAIFFQGRILFCWGKFISSAYSSTYAESYAILEGLMGFAIFNSQLPCRLSSDSATAVFDCNAKNFDGP